MRFHFSSQKNIPKRKDSQKGFAMLIAISIIAVLVSIAYIMFSISLKQIGLSTTGKNSITALYAADTGIECALYADLKVEDSSFVKNTPEPDGSITINIPDASPGIYCNNAPVTMIQYPTKSGGSLTIGNFSYDQSVITTFQIPAIGDPSCTIVTVTKYVDDKDHTSTGGYDRTTYNAIGTHVESRGYNSCESETDPQRLERGLEVYY